MWGAAGATLDSLPVLQGSGHSSSDLSSWMPQIILGLTLGVASPTHLTSSRPLAPNVHRTPDPSWPAHLPGLSWPAHVSNLISYHTSLTHSTPATPAS